MTSFCFHALFQVTVIDENGEDRRVFRGIMDDTYSEVQGFSVSATVNVSKLCFEEHVLINPYPTAFPYGNGMVLHFYQQQESSTTKTVHKVINKGLKTYV